MASPQVGDIRNVALVGHTGAGKTTLGEALLLKAGITNRLGSVDDGTSLLDHDEESKERKHSLDSAVFWLEHAGKLLNLIDTPGMPDHCGPAIASLIGVETGLVVVSAAGGISVNTRRMFNAAGDFGLARMIVVTRITAENTNLEEIYESLRASFGTACHAINLPAEGGKKIVDVLASASGDSDFSDVATAHTQLLEAIVETDDALMEAYMESGSVPAEKLRPAIAAAVASGQLIPVLFVDAAQGVGVNELLEALVTYAPSPLVGKQRALVTGSGAEALTTPIEPKADGPFIAQTLKVTTDPKSNIKYCVLRVFSGTLGDDATLYLRDDRKGQRPGHVFKLRGSQHSEVPTATVGDIVALSKLDLHVGDMAWDAATEGSVPLPKLPQPMYSLAVTPKARGDIEKIGAAMSRFADEDPCFQYHRDPETGELLMSGMGDMHLTVIQGKMKRYFKVEMETHTPKIPYRETISTSVKYVDYTHKKQTGGAGQYGKGVSVTEGYESGAAVEFVY